MKIWNLFRWPAGSPPPEPEVEPTAQQKPEPCACGHDHFRRMLDQTAARYQATAQFQAMAANALESDVDEETQERLASIFGLCDEDFDKDPDWEREAAEVDTGPAINRHWTPETD